MSFGEKISHHFQKKLGIDESDPDIADPSRREFVKAAVGAGLLYFGSNEILRRVNPLLELLTEREFRGDPLLSTTTVYSPNAFRNSTVVAVGDSLILRRGQSPVWKAADKVKKHFGSNWSVVMLAREGEDMDDILRQQQAAARYMKPGMDVDIVASGGGNDLLECTLENPRMKARIDRLMDNPLSLDAFTVAQTVHDGIAVFTEKFYRLLWNINSLRQQGVKVHRIILESVTNMGYINIDDKTIRQSKIPLPSNNEELAHRIGANISSRLVGGMLDAAHRLGETGMDILLINNFDSKDLADIHLDDKGQEEAIDQQFARSYADFTGVRKSLLEAM